MGGGTIIVILFAPLGVGLSPRGRGNPGATMHYEDGDGSIPAWAGEPHGVGSPLYGQRVYPRVGGGTQYFIGPLFTAWGLSPRGRGNRLRLVRVSRAIGSIPAWAGEPSRSRSQGVNPSVYPRVGGGTPSTSGDWRGWAGLSPRGRGNRR